MPQPTDLNALYQEWLEIPADRLPPNHYALLGLDDFESDRPAIESAAHARNAYLHQIASGPQRKIVQQMLGQVAVARRTLMNDAAKLEYDASLHQQAERVADAAPSQRAAQPDDAGTPLGRKKPSDWTYHLASAAVLLLIVGAIYWFNRNPGGRRAADVGPESARPAIDVSSNHTGGVHAIARSSTARKAPPTVSNASDTPRRSPIAKRRSSGSGLASGLDNSFDDLISDIANQPSELAGSKSGEGFVPLRGLMIGKPDKKVDDANWPADWTAVDAFPGALGERFECERGFKWFDVQDASLTFDLAGKPSEYRLQDTEQTLAKGSSVGITASIGPQIKSAVQVGFEIDGIRIGVRPTKTGIEVFARDRGKGAPIESVSKINSDDSTVSLMVTRDEQEDQLLRWQARTGPTTQTGKIDVTSLDASPALSLYVVRPKKGSEQSIRITDYRTGAPR